VRLEGESLAAWCALPIASVARRLEALSLTARDREMVGDLVADLLRRLEVLEQVGLGYLPLDRLTRTLSGGEAQRIELAQALGARLVDALYVLDEPTVGLHPRDTGRLLALLRTLARNEATVVVVEHDPEVIAAADYMVDLGPGSGRAGGTLVYCGSPADRLDGAPSPTRDLLAGVHRPSRPVLRAPAGWLRLRRAGIHNLDDLDADVPLGVLVGVCGVSGSGKSSLVRDTLVPLVEQHLAGDASLPERLGTLEVEGSVNAIALVDQSPLGRGSRSIPASYVGAWGAIRALFAALPESRRRGLSSGTFSFNRPGGRCDVCKGEGETVVDMDFMPDVRIPCEACGGERFGSEARAPRYRGLNIVDVLAMSADEAVAAFAERPAIVNPLWWMQRVGLGYLHLGQPAATLSGGEAGRLKLVRSLGGVPRGRLYVLDEPTVGLHGTEVARLVEILRELTRAGASVVVVEHHLELLAACDWLLELGPEAGADGGRLIASGPPEVVARRKGSRTGPYLAPILGRSRTPSRLGAGSTRPVS